jgi:hypothetical protein
MPLRYPARIELFSPDVGGLRESLMAPTRSLLLLFGEGPSEKSIGAFIEADADRFAPGEAYDVTLVFWADEAGAELAQPGAQFRLWHAKPVGVGIVQGAGYAERGPSVEGA